MKLEKFTKNKKQKRIVIGSIVGILFLIGGITLYKTFALYKVEQSFDVLKGTVPDFSSGDVTLAFTVNDKMESGIPFPNKNEGFKVDGVTCYEGITADWDNDTWSLTNINNPNSQSKIKCTIKFKRYEEEILNGAYPVLKEGLVPVTIDDEGNVTKADITENWYEYADKKWANAVILTEEGKKKNIAEGSTISEDDIESYFVWIPKYKYQLFDMGAYENVNEELDTEKQNQAIEIEFGTENTTDTKESCKTPMESGESGHCKVDDWMTHPAFISFDVNGFWVGKFETSDAGGSKVQIKPNKTSWRNINVATMFNTSKEYKKNLVSHMMKNTEWGAVAYLTQSIYGRCENGSCSEITINSNPSYTTGYTKNETPYPQSKDASTTGNNTGIYDMSGGAWDTMASVMTTVVNPALASEISFESSGLLAKDILNLSYVDLYAIGEETKYNRRILGDATGELGPFQSSENSYISSYFGDDASFIVSNSSWFIRGGRYVHANLAGIFTFDGFAGGSSDYHGFRIVLALQ